MLLKWCFLLLTLLSVSFNVNGAEVTPAKDGKIEEVNQNTRKQIEDFIKAQVKENVGARQAEVTDAEYNITRDIKEAVDNIMTNLYKDTKQIIDKFNSAYREVKILEAIGKIDNRLVVIEDENKVTVQDIQKLINATGQIAKCCNGMPIAPSDGDNQTCAVKVPSSVQNKDNIWVEMFAPKMDDVDTYLNNTKGCKYEAVQIRDSFYVPDLTFTGAPIEAHFAVRTEAIATIRVWWKPSRTAEYKIEFGFNGTRVINAKVYPEVTLATVTSPSILSTKTYTHFYVIIDNGTITFGRTCGGVNTPLFTDKIIIKKQDIVNIRFDPFSKIGGKVVYNCPAGVL